MATLPLFFGFAAGLATSRVKWLAIVATGLALLWACLIGIGAANDLADVAGAFVVGAANAGVGVAVGAAIRLIGLVVLRLGPKHLNRFSAEAVLRGD